MPYCEECGQPFLGAGRFCDRCLLSINEPSQTKLETPTQIQAQGQLQSQPTPYQTQNQYYQYSGYQHQYQYPPATTYPQYGGTYPYTQQSYYYYTPVYDPEKKSGDTIGIIGIVFGIIGFFLIGFVTGIIAMICGFIAMSKRSKELGIISVILGLITFCISLFWLFLMFSLW